jgi:hypothetical protein
MTLHCSARLVPFGSALRERAQRIDLKRKIEAVGGLALCLIFLQRKIVVRSAARSAQAFIAAHENGHSSMSVPDLVKDCR